MCLVNMYTNAHHMLHDAYFWDIEFTYAFMLRTQGYMKVFLCITGAFFLILISLLEIHWTVWDHVSSIWRRMAQKLIVKAEGDNMRRLLFQVCQSGNLLRGFFVIDESVLSQGYRPPKPLVSGLIFKHLTAVNALVNTQHCCYWCPGAKAPGYQ